MKYNQVEYWAHMLDEAFSDIPQDQMQEKSKLFQGMMRKNSLSPAKEILNILRTWFIADSETMSDEELSTKYSKTFLQECIDRLTNYFSYKKQIGKDSINLNGQPFNMKNDVDVRMSENRSVEYLNEITDSMLNLINSEFGQNSKLDDSQIEAKYKMSGQDKSEIKILGFTSDIICWRTSGFETTNKFIFYIWRNPEMGGGYGKYMKNSPFCTRSKQHWYSYSHQNPEYEQFWFFKIPEGCTPTVGNLNDQNVADILSKMSGHGGELLVGLDDTYGDMTNIDDENANRTSLLDFNLYDYEHTDYSSQIKSFYGKCLFATSEHSEFSSIGMCISSKKKQSLENNQNAMQESRRCKYSRKQILEAIAHWKRVLKETY